MPTLSNLTYYPIKACRGFDLQSSNVERMGLEHDRRMMVVTPEGEFLYPARTSQTRAHHAHAEREGNRT